VASLAVSATGATEASPSAGPLPTRASIERAVPRDPNTSDPSLIAKAEVLLDQAHVSPGEIDGADGDNFRGAVRAFQAAKGLKVSGDLDVDTWKALAGDGATDVLQDYTVSDADVTGPFTKAIPTQLEEMARLPGLSYTSAVAELAEKFHMSPDLLRALNPNADFGKAGAKIVVADVRGMDLRPGRDAVEVVPTKDDAGPVAATIVIDKPGRNLRAYDQDGKFPADYPVTVGSEEKPAPSGDFRVKRVDWNPEYHYDPRFAWKEVKARKKLTVRSGPNNPVGLVWIDLTAPSYGIHGTPTPDAIGKTGSHGCIRLTNWDAADLAAMAHPGTVVRFEDQGSPVAAVIPVDEAKSPRSARPAP
jgi:lipoprotein-anchoring transpeptidase ErfK/SrfK